MDAIGAGRASGRLLELALQASEFLLFALFEHGKRRLLGRIFQPMGAMFLGNELLEVLSLLLVGGIIHGCLGVFDVLEACR